MMKNIYILILIAIVIGAFILFFVANKTATESPTIGQQKDLRAQSIDEIKKIIEDEGEDIKSRERAIFELTNIALKSGQQKEAREYLKSLLINNELPNDLFSPVMANIDLIDELYPRGKHGSMDIYIIGKPDIGNTITIVVELISDRDVEEVLVGAGELVTDAAPKNILVAVSPQKIRTSLKANEPKRFEFRFEVAKAGTIEIPVKYKFSFDRIDYETQKKFLLFNITSEGGKFSGPFEELD